MIELQQAHILSAAPLALTTRVVAETPARTIAWQVTNPGPGAFHGVVRLVLPLPDDLRAPWFMVPGFLYGENRRASQWAPRMYARFDPAVTAPREMASSWWDLPADRTAAPLVYAHEGTRCFALASAPHYEASAGVASDDPEPQVGVGFSAGAAGHYLRINVPATEEPFNSSRRPDRAAVIRRVCLPAGASLRGTLLVFDFAGTRHDYQRVMETYHAVVGAAHEPAPLPEIVPLMRDAAHGILAHHHAAGNYFIYSRPYDPVIEQIANARGITSEWHQMMTGFVGGFPVCLALLLAAQRTGDAAPRDVARLVADRICREGVSPSGLFWADFAPRQVVTPNGSFPNPLCPSGRNEWGSGWLAGTTRVHSRTVADACNALAAMIEVERATHPDSPSLPLWEGALLRNLETALDLQLADGSFGQYYDAVARTIAKPDGCGGLLWLPAMVKAIRLGLGGPALAARMRSALRRAADAYGAYVDAEYIWGAPEDNDSPTSEDGMNAVLAYADLYEFSGDPRDLARARLAADWLLTFRKTYNERLPPLSLMGRYGMRSKGGDYASASNNHLHVFEVLVTRQLCQLTRWTGNPYYRERARDHWAFVCQYLSRCDGMYNGFRGAMAEQFYWCDYGSWGKWQPPAYHHQKGNMAPFTALWCIAVLLSAAPDAEREFMGG